MISLCLTIKNEKVLPVIREVVKQTKLPDETVIIISGKKTAEKIDKNILKKLNIKLVFHESNRSGGRNAAANYATHENLIFIDSGCVLDKNLVRTMSSSLEAKNAEIIAGRYQSIANNFQEYLFSKFMNRDISDKKVFYPSARIFGIKKRIFASLNGFRADLDTAEDTEFFKRVLDEGYSIQKNTKAIVTWRLPSLRKYLRKIFTYARGDAESDIWWDKRKKLGTHNIKHTLTLMRWSALFMLIFLGFTHFADFLLLIYLSSSALKNKIDYSQFADKNILKIGFNLITYVIIKILTDFAALSGFVVGMF